MNGSSEPNNLYDLLDFLCSNNAMSLAHMATAYDRCGRRDKAAELMDFAREIDVVQPMPEIDRKADAA